MWLWLGTAALFLGALTIPMSLKQSRRLVPIFEQDPVLRDAVRVPGSPFLWLGGPWYLGIHYTTMLTVIYLMPAGVLDREASRLPCSKAEFLQHFSPGDIRRNLVLSVLAFATLVLGMLGFFLMPAGAR